MSKMNQSHIALEGGVGEGGREKWNVLPIFPKWINEAFWSLIGEGRGWGKNEKLFQYVQNGSKSRSLVGREEVREKWKILPICPKWIKITECWEGVGWGWGVREKWNISQNFPKWNKVTKHGRGWEGGEGKMKMCCQYIQNGCVLKLGKGKGLREK